MQPTFEMLSRQVADLEKKLQEARAQLYEIHGVHVDHAHMAGSPEQALQGGGMPHAVKPSNGFWTWIREQDLLVLSEEARTFLGLQGVAGHLSSYDFLKILHPEDRPRHYHSLRQLVAQKLACSNKLQLQHQSGQYQTFAVTVRPLADAHGKLIGLEGCLAPWQEGGSRGGPMSDGMALTHGQHIGQHLLENCPPLIRAFLDNTNLLVFIKDSRLRHVFANKALEEIFGGMDRVLLKQDHEIFPKEVADLFRQNDEEVLRTMKPGCFIEKAPIDSGVYDYIYVFKFPIVLADGSCYLAGAAVPIADHRKLESQLKDTLKELEKSNGHLKKSQEELSLAYEEMAAANEELQESNERYLILLGDLQQAKSELEKSEERLRVAAISSRTALWEWNLKVPERSWFSPFLSHMLGYKGKDEFKTAEDLFNKVHPDDQERVQHTLQLHIADQTPYEIEYRIICKNKKYKWVQSTGEVYFDEKGEPLKVMGAVVDIHHAKQTAFQLADLKNKLEMQVEERTKALEESERKFRNAFEFSGIGICLVNMEGKIFEENLAFYKILGCQKKNCRGLFFSRFLAPEGFKTFLSKTRQLLDKERDYFQLIAPLQHVRGHAIWANLTISIVWDEVERRPLYFIMQIEDITDAKEAEEQIRQQKEIIQNHNEELNIALENLHELSMGLQKSEEKYRLIAENITDLVTLHDSQGKYLYASPSLKAMLGYKPEEVLGKNAYAFIHYEDIDRVWQESHNMILTGEKYARVSYRMRHKNGHYIYVESKSKGLLDDNGELAQIQAVTRDVTEQQLATTTLKWQSTQISFILNNLPLILFSLDDKGNITYISGNILKLFAPNSEVLVGKSIMDIIPLQAEEKSYIHEAFSGQTVSWEGVYGEVYFSHNLVPIKNADGKIEQVIGLTEDITSKKRNEEYLRYLTSALINIHDAVLIIDHETLTADKFRVGEIIYANPAFTRIFGYELEEIRGKSPAVLQGKETNTRAIQEIGKAIRKLMPFSKELLVYPKEGEPLWTDITISPVNNGKGQLTHWVAVLRDITDRKKAEELLYQERQLFHEGIAVAMKWEITKKGAMVRYVSPNIYQYGYQPEDFMDGKLNYMDDFIYEEDREQLRDTLAKVRREKGDKILADYRVCRKDGSICWVQDYTVYRYDEHLVSGYGYIIDITDRKNAEEALRETLDRELLAEQKFKSIAEHFPNGWVALISQNCRLEYLGGSELPHFATTPQMKGEDNILKLFPESYQKQLQSAIEGVAEGRPANFDFRDQQKYYLINMVPLVSKGARPIILMTGQNITTIKESLRREKELNDLKSRFVSMTSHQFRTPLSTIQTNIELMARSESYIDADFRPKFQRYAARTKRQIERLTDLMNDILILGRIEAGRLEPNKKMVDMPHFMNDLIAQYEQLSKESRKIKLTIKGRPREICMDAGLMNHAIGNLLSNALKYSVGRPDPEVCMQFDKKTLAIEIKDYGIGIPEADQKNLFKSFFRASNTLDIEGTGLGLIISQQILEAHGGFIDLTTQEGKGTTFTLKLPAANGDHTCD